MVSGAIIFFIMLKTTKFCYPIVFLLFFIRTGWAQSQVNVPVKATPDICLDTPSYQLYLLINDYRNDHNLPGIPLSGSLCYIAQVHAKDLTFNRSRDDECGFHSWSDKGRWSPCCFSADAPAFMCMWNKPKELTAYRYKGYEIIYWENDQIEPLEAMAQWKHQSHFEEMILLKGTWAKKNWNAIGTAIYEGFAIIWLGEEPDVKGEPDLCDEIAAFKSDTTSGKNPPAEKPSYMSDVRYYLIAASLTTMDKANQALLEYHQKGFNSARIITFDNKIRISLNDFDTYTTAKKVKTDLGVAYQNVWILER